MWRPARVPIRHPGRPVLAQQEAPAAPPAERPSWTTESLVGTGVGALTGALIAAVSGKKLAGNEILAGGGAGFVVANILRLV